MNVTERLKALHNEMRELTLDSGVGVKRYERMVKNIERKRTHTIERIYNFLADVYEHEWCEVHRVWTLPTMSEDVWFNYLNLFSDTHFPEVYLLKAARKNLKARYVAFYKPQKKETGSEDTA